MLRVCYTSQSSAAAGSIRANADAGRHLPRWAREAGYRLGSERGSPNHGSTLASKWVMAQI